VPTTGIQKPFFGDDGDSEAFFWRFLNVNQEPTGKRKPKNPPKKPKSSKRRKAQ
jgi:hypothetical protein